MYLSHLLTGGWFFFDQASAEAKPQTRETIRQNVLARVAQNARAVRLEVELSACHRENIVGRSSSFLLLYDIICTLAGRSPDARVLKVLEDFIFLVQLADDLGDWREDHRSSRWTSILRTCFHRAGRVLCEAEVEEQLYLGGLYEERSAQIINGLQEILAELDRMPGVRSARFRSLVQTQHDRLVEALSSWVAAKLSARSSGAAVQR